MNIVISEPASPGIASVRVFAEMVSTCPQGSALREANVSYGVTLPRANLEKICIPVTVTMQDNNFAAIITNLRAQIARRVAGQHTTVTVSLNMDRYWDMRRVSRRAQCSHP